MDRRMTHPHEIRRIAVGEVTLWARRDGAADRPAVLLIAGANACHLMWPDEFCALLLTRGLGVVRYDHRDTGRSSHVDFDARPYTVTTLAEDAVAVLDGFDIAAAHFVGLSLGGTLVQAALLDQPQRMLSATIMLTAALDVDFVGNLVRVYSGQAEPTGLPLPSKKVLDRLGRRDIEVGSAEEELDRRVAEWMALSGPADGLDPEEFRRWEARAIAHAGSWKRSSQHALAQPIALSRGVELARVRTPTLVIQGGQDPLNPPPHGRHIAELIAGARLVEVPELGHSLPGFLHARLASVIGAHIERARQATRQR